MKTLKIKETGSSMLRLEQEYKILLSRYRDCDKEGHYAPDNPEKNRCGHCFRNLNYNDDILSQNINDFNLGMRGISYLLPKA